MVRKPVIAVDGCSCRPKDSKPQVRPMHAGTSQPEGMPARQGEGCNWELTGDRVCRKRRKETVRRNRQKRLGPEVPKKRGGTERKEEPECIV